MYSCYVFIVIIKRRSCHFPPDINKQISRMWTIRSSWNIPSVNILSRLYQNTSPLMHLCLPSVSERKRADIHTVSSFSLECQSCGLARLTGQMVISHSWWTWREKQSVAATPSSPIPLLMLSADMSSPLSLFPPPFSSLFSRYATVLFSRVLFHFTPTSCFLCPTSLPFLRSPSPPLSSILFHPIFSSLHLSCLPLLSFLYIHHFIPFPPIF